MPQSLV